NFGQMNQGSWIQALLDDYKRGLNEKKLNLDDYMRFLRFGQWRIEQSGHGILAMITNNSFLDSLTRRRMRESLRETFTEIYILDLHGSTRRGEVPPSGITDANVFDIQQGVAISLFIKQPGVDGPARIFHADLWGSRELKYEWLSHS